jgi:hypothetical protein
MDGYDMLSATLSGDGQLSWALLEGISIVGLFNAVTVWLPHMTRATGVMSLGWSLLATLIAFMGVCVWCTGDHGASAPFHI